MGLDTFARVTVDGESRSLEDSLFEGVMLTGGMFSGGGASFRGKVYADLIEEVTGVDLYQERIEPEVVKEMAKKISTYAAKSPDCVHEVRPYHCDRCDITHLKRWFQIAAENDAYLHGWW